MPSFETSSDEALLLLSREGNLDARFVLTERYFRLRKESAKRASYALAKILEDWDLNLSFFIAFENCFMGYQFGKGRFSTYFLGSLRHEMSKEAEKEHLLDGLNPVSLDNTVPGSEGEYTFHDVISSTGEDPRIYVNYLEEAMSLGKIGEDLTEETLEAARLRIDGLSFRAIAEKMNVNIKRVRKLYSQYEKYVSGKIKFGSAPASKKK
jgi:hypothetical protein